LASTYWYCYYISDFLENSKFCMLWITVTSAEDIFPQVTLSEMPPKNGDFE